MNKSLRSRMGNVMRRSSTILTMSRPSTPARTDSDAGSLASVKQADTSSLAPPPAEPPVPSMPSPIAESPAGESQVLTGEPIVGSPPSTEPVVAESPRDIPPDLPSDGATGQTLANPTPEIVETAPTPTAPGPGAFTDVFDQPKSQENQTPENPLNEVAAASEPQPVPPVNAYAAEDKQMPSRDQLDEPAPEIVLSTPRSAYGNVVEDTAAEQPSSEPTQGIPQSHLSHMPNASRQLTPKGSSTSSLYAPGEISVPMYPQASPHASKVSLVPSARGGQGQAGSLTPPFGRGNGHAGFDQSIVPSVRSTGLPSTDPFADSQAMPVFSNSPKEGVYMPVPELPYSDEAPFGHIVMPLPTPQEVMASGSILNASGYSLGGKAPTTVAVSHETDERRPLLSRPASPNHDRQPSYLQPSGSGYIALSSRVSQNSAYHSVSTPLLRNFGWIEYILPDASFYYVHPTLRVTTDIDLRSTKKLELVTAYLDHKDAGAPVSLEIWLQNSGSSKHDFVPFRIWIDHRKRGVSFDSPLARESDVGGSKHPGDDRLDMEYRYWSFVEGHPAHITLPPNARTDAMDALSWAYADRLLPTHQRAPPPFTQGECQELMNVLRTFGDASDQPSNHSMVHTRIIARILLRVAHWRQIHLRPGKGLPLDAAHRGRRAVSRIPFRRTIVDFFISVLCLGIPYFFIERSSLLRADEEGGLRGAVPKLVIWASTSLVAAVVLSTSVTFLSLPGLDNITRVAGFVAVFFSTASITSSVIALLRFKADVDREMASVGGEGLMIQPRRCLVMSLPLVFLAYSIAAFITGISFYSFRGTTTVNPQVVAHPFDDYVKWTVVGAIGGLVAMLAASAWLSRH